MNESDWISDEDYDLTPTPSILQMLGEIEYEPWRCIAEFIDNSFDAYFTIIESEPNWLENVGLPHYSVNIGLPTQKEYKEGNAVVSVQDIGPGMSRQQLAKAVKAGFSSNDALSRLGLFGMGFNVAMARLGKAATVYTTRIGDDYYSGVRIDLDTMIKTGKFIGQGFKIPCSSDEHGTIIEVTGLKPEFYGSLTQGGGITSIRNNLSRIYSPILNEHPVVLRTKNSNQIHGWKHCIWAENRYAEMKSGLKIPAFKKIDYKLSDNYFCGDCWGWFEASSVLDKTKCPICGDSDEEFSLKERRIHGWIGIQRHFDMEHYGIDFVRNGRVILTLDKEVFYCTNPSGEKELEYPLDTKYLGGRIVGQINADFIPTEYHKRFFKQGSKAWRETINYLRGPGPLRPKIATKYGYGENDSPLNLFYKAFKAAKQSGVEQLYPGKPDKPLQGDNATPAKWAEKFWDGDEDFQSDEKWWNLVKSAQDARIKAKINKCGVCGKIKPCDCQEEEEEEEIDPSDPFGKKCEKCDEPLPCNCQEKDDDPFANMELNLTMSGTYQIPLKDGPAPIYIDVYLDNNSYSKNDFKNKPPVDATYEKPTKAIMIYHPEHPAFSQFAENPYDYILMEIAQQFSTRIGQGSEWNIGKCYQYLKEEFQPAEKLDLDGLGEQAREILADLKTHLSMQSISKEINTVSDEIRKQVSAHVLRTVGKGSTEVEQYFASGKWIEAIHHEHLINIVKENPHLVMDNTFFSQSYSDITYPELRQESLDNICSALQDAMMIKISADRGASPEKLMMLRANSSLQWLNEKRVI